MIDEETKKKIRDLEEINKILLKDVHAMSEIVERYYRGMDGKGAGCSCCGRCSARPYQPSGEWDRV